MLHLTLRQLQVFEASARHLSFSRAARELHLTQPGVSSQLKQLEAVIGMPLFEQVGRQVFLTAAGKELYNHTRLLQQQLSVLEASLDQLRDTKQGKLKVSLVSGTANPLALQLIANFSRAFPGVTVSLSVGNRECVLNELATNETDLAIMGAPPEGQGLVAVRVASNPLVIIAPPDHALARERRIALHTIERETFLMREPGSGTRRAIERFFAEHRINFRPGMEVSSNEAVKWAVQAGMGLSVIALATIMAELETLRLKVLDVEHFPILRYLYLVHRESKQLSSAACAFRESLMSGAQEAGERVAMQA
ncbi:LysR substrate-binding domain-containing protein [Paraburkholderia sp. CNPSo 3076]|uniref:LysR family transcriptional regulator n=1 Tax=Paraburkholderia sp. CNPSo 3076 TaxID=2940936 RepID=UPI00224E582F|nr:LysR family transcriptional regulator [Paraburkholderia sp. CNPSo 3076]MCX5544090.1 LysR substrate-binding domain-containing protein [Paraburkholderia sp. CNPSo 3076]